MSFYKWSLYLAFALFTTPMFAQQVEITGEILEKDTKKPVPYVHIVNAANQEGTVSNTEGRFWVHLNPGDTLLFSAIGFDQYAYVLKDDITTNKLILTIHLNTSTMELEPVNVFAFRDEYALKRAMLEMDVPIEEEQGIKISGLKAAKPQGPGGIVIGGPLTALANVFSKEHKEQKKFAAYQKAYDTNKLIKAKYNEAVVLEVTGLPEDKVEEFMAFCKMDDSFLKRATEYELTVVLHQCLSDFQKLEE